MKENQLKFIVGVVSAIYFIIVTALIFKKPEGWFIWPTSWQQAWHPNYFLYIVLLGLGVAAAYYGYRMFKNKQ